MFQRPLWSDDASFTKKKISPDTEHAIKEITTYIGMLSDYFMKDKVEPLEFD